MDAYIALTEFSRQKFIQGGLPSDRLFVKPNFVQSKQTIGQGDGGFALYLGRLSEEKGISTLLSAWSKLRGKVRLIIAGDGPLRSEVERASKSIKGVEAVGAVAKDRAADLLRNAWAVIVPSIWYEGFPMVVAEAFAAGVPVIASNLGSLNEIINHRHTGLHYLPGNPEGLASQIKWLLSHEKERQQMRLAARREYEMRYTPNRNYERLMAIYSRVQSRTATGSNPVRKSDRTTGAAK